METRIEVSRALYVTMIATVSCTDISMEQYASAILPTNLENTRHIGKGELCATESSMVCLDRHHKLQEKRVGEDHGDDHGPVIWEHVADDH